MKYAMQPWTVKKDTDWAEINQHDLTSAAVRTSAASADTSQVSAHHDYDRRDANLRKNVFDVQFQHVKLTPANDPAPARRRRAVQKVFDNQGLKFLDTFLTRVGVYQ